MYVAAGKEGGCGDVLLALEVHSSCSAGGPSNRRELLRRAERRFGVHKMPPRRALHPVMAGTHANRESKGRVDNVNLRRHLSRA